MDGDPKDGTENDGGPNKTDPIPGMGGKTQADIKIRNGQVNLENMDDDLAAAVKAGDEQHVRARLGGDRKLSDAEALILIKTREEEERIAYQQAHATDAQTADVHRKEDGDGSFWSRVSKDWEAEPQSSTRVMAQGGRGQGEVQPDGFIYDAQGGRTDATFGFHQDKEGNITTKNGDVFDAKTNTYRLANGETGQTLTPELQAAGKEKGIPDKDLNAHVVKTAEAIAAATGGVAGNVLSSTATAGGDVPKVELSHEVISQAQQVTQREIAAGMLGATADALVNGTELPPQTRDIVAHGQPGKSSQFVEQKPGKRNKEGATLSPSVVAAAQRATSSIASDGTVTVEIPATSLFVASDTQASSTSKFNAADVVAAAQDAVKEELGQASKPGPKPKTAPTV
jgi:hypothetical protein